MRVKLKDLNNAVRMVKQLASDMTAAPGILVAIKSGAIDIIYCDNKKAVYKQVEAETSPEEVALDKVIFEYISFMAGIDKIQPSGRLLVEDVVLDLSDMQTNIMKIEAEKKVLQYVDTEHVDVLTVSKINHPVKAYLAGAQDLDKKFQSLTRFDYEKMLFQNNGFDTWDKSVLSNLLRKLGKGDDGKGCYIIKKNKAGFVVNRSSLYFVRANEGLENFSFTLNCKLAKYIVEILNRYDGDTVNVFVTDNRYCSMVADDNSFGVWMEMAAYRQQDGAILQKYQMDAATGEPRAYNDIELLLNKEATLDMIKTLKAGDKGDNAVVRLDFNDTDDIHSIQAIDKSEATEDDKSDESAEGKAVEAPAAPIADTELTATDSDDAPWDAEETDEEEAKAEVAMNLPTVEGLTQPEKSDTEKEDTTISVAMIMGDEKKKNVNKMYVPANVKDGNTITELSLVYNVWEGILSICDGQYVKLGIYKADEKNNYLRFADLVIDENMETKTNAYMYTIATNRQ